MSRGRRKIIHIDERLCNGCGLCVTPCAEAALEVVDGKARVIREELCDGAGVCLAVCPTGALTIEEREAPAFDEEAAARHKADQLDAAARAATGGSEAAALPRCLSCGASDADRPLLPVRRAGCEEWVCVKCLPGLIHG